jgi:methionyl-tRNA formyltransferase
MMRGSPLRVVFFGSGRFAVPSLEALAGASRGRGNAGALELVAVVSQPDRPRGRGRGVAPPPTATTAARLALPLLQPRRVKAPEAVGAIRDLAADLHVVVAYGQILSPELLEIPRLGSVNVHGSLLPRYRGAAPIQWAIASGETQTGVSTMLMDEGLDTGPVLLQRALEIGPDETAAQLEPRLAEIGAALLLDSLAGLASGALRATPQDTARASLAPLLRKADANVEWQRPAAAIANRLRGFQPWPGATAWLAGRPLRLHRVRPQAGAPAAPGEILAIDADGVRVACGDRTQLVLFEVQPESRRAMPAADWARGARLAPGQRFDPAPPAAP